MKKKIIGILWLSPMLLLAQQKEFNWLVGKWQEEGKPSFEIWKSKDTYLLAESYAIESGIKKINETIKIVKKGNDFYFIASVKDQGSTEFKITWYNKNSFVAENPRHDFPRKINYKKTDANHIHASIGDNTKTIDYFFTKVP
ncbi:MAG: hypothetical protein JST48_03920 [Bacteroidetes bacterium]|nr:hypothetical protein [Bacteroidota bacterium]